VLREIKNIGSGIQIASEEEMMSKLQVLAKHTGSDSIEVRAYYEENKVEIINTLSAKIDQAMETLERRIQTMSRDIMGEFR